MSKRSYDEDALTKYLVEKIKRELEEDMMKRSDNMQLLDMVETQIIEEKDDDDVFLPSTSKRVRSKNEAQCSLKVSNVNKDNNILNMLLKPRLDENVRKMGENITTKLVESWQDYLANGLDLHDKMLVEAEHPTPKNCLMINPPEINSLVKSTLTESVIRKDAELQNKQKAIAVILTCVSKALTKLNDSNGDGDVIKILVDAGKLLCDFQHNESVARRSAIVNRFSKETKNLLLENKIDTSLFGEKWKNTLIRQLEDMAMRNQSTLQNQPADFD